MLSTPIVCIVLVIINIHSSYFQTRLRKAAKGTFSTIRGKRKGKGKAVSLQAWTGPEGSSKLRFLDFVTMSQDSGKVVILTHRPPLLPGNTPGTHFC
jgi:hypothetical protein